MNIQNDYAIIEPNSQDLFNHPYIYMTGHGNVLFSQSDVTNMRKYLQRRGFYISMIIMAWINIFVQK